MNHMFKNKILSARRAGRLDCSHDEYTDSPSIVKCASQEAKAAPKHNPLLPLQIWEAQPSALCRNPLKKHLHRVCMSETTQGHLSHQSGPAQEFNKQD